MTDVTIEIIEKLIETWTDPYLGQDLVSAGAVKEISVDQDRIEVRVALPYAASGHHADCAKALSGIIEEAAPGRRVDIAVSSLIEASAPQGDHSPLPGIKNILVVASGKGGVGKSTTSVNLALALAAEGASAGILDADIHGPSQAHMLGLKGKPETPDGKRMEPMEGHGLQAMSIGLLVDEDSPVIWRGPMVTRALTQLLTETNWRDLDYLIIDLPPGTGDIPMTLAQQIPISGAVIVTTPQDIALLDARKGLRMFEKVNVPVLGLVENMSTHICSECGHEEPIFGHGGGRRMAEEYGVNLLGALPLDRRIREETDGGHPTVTADPNGDIAGIYRDIARRLSAQLVLQEDAYSQSCVPSVVVTEG